MAKQAQPKTAKSQSVNIEGTQYSWDQESISVVEVRRLGNLPQGLAVVEEFANGTEKTLKDSDVVMLKPGQRFGRAPKFKRG
ncbi:MAG: multiubiquitin domain-containing protein [Candidatus Omnitrophica bacterium]|nr:multiubiquitin domain-containing protein [Candidatus Omnitrophota bacterium]